MYNYNDMEVDYWKRKALGLLPRKEVVLPASSIMTTNKFVNRSLQITQKNIKRGNK